MLRHFFPMGSGGERGSVSGFRLAERAQICLNMLQRTRHNLRGK